MSKDILKLDNQICFPLYAATREMTKRYRPLLEELNVTYPQYIVLLVLWETDRISVKALGERLFLDSGTLTPMLKRMEEHGFIQRIRSKEDERIVEVVLTKQGKQAEKQAEKIPLKFIEQTNLNETEAMQLKQILFKMLGN
ncbi:MULTISPECIES: MarR family transcriptional regulator [Oceanobacillus]|uniref:HTH-type transcriptional regulator SarZ n=1 Tax=Oceanobacillus kimchii TaxID=746691 RepID=A0ABQ5TR48_9BACI|nr:MULTISPECIES: MarR family transcriptional regulator [Oceanobacillus]MBT2599934.1 MarR family transcriptional regulator [Oceanobacillus sp. ISL-74]MBT2652616.1 MarR family transcriptional regulator [Oceanobacillus sp. ISL-73]GLO68194.1 MarR family transcriptional regulator [Oceanobacillus kimchii]